MRGKVLGPASYRPTFQDKETRTSLSRDGRYTATRGKQLWVQFESPGGKWNVYPTEISRTVKLAGGYKIGDTVFSLTEQEGEREEGETSGDRIHVGMRGKVYGPDPDNKKMLRIEFESPGGNWSLYPVDITAAEEEARQSAQRAAAADTAPPPPHNPQWAINREERKTSEAEQAPAAVDQKPESVASSNVHVDSGNTCVLCKVKKPNYICYPCGHKCICGLKCEVLLMGNT